MEIVKNMAMCFQSARKLDHCRVCGNGWGSIADADTKGYSEEKSRKTLCQLCGKETYLRNLRQVKKTDTERLFRESKK